MATFVKSSSPHIRKPVTTKRMMSDVLIALFPLVIFSVFQFGLGALLRVVISVVVMMGAEIFTVMIRHKPHPRVEGFKARTKERFSKVTSLNYITPAISAIIFTMMIPVAMPIYVLVISALLGIVIAKLVFGGLGSNIFNPAAVSFVIAQVSFITAFKYIQPDMIAGATPIGALGGVFYNITEGLKEYSLLDLFLGNKLGGMGEVSAVLIIIGGIYLLARRAADWRIVVSMLGTFTFLMLIAGLRADAENVHIILTYQLLTGGILFGAVFMATDPVTAPVTAPGRYLYGILIGSLVVLIRLFGSLPEGVAYSILIMNMFVPLIDYHKWSKNKVGWKMGLIYGGTLLVIALVVLFGVGGMLPWNY